MKWCREERCKIVELHPEHLSSKPHRKFDKRRTSYKEMIERRLATLAKKEVARQTKERAERVAKAGYAPGEIVWSQSNAILALIWRCPCSGHIGCRFCRGRGRLQATYNEMFQILVEERKL